jgi:Ca-activated chloride channel family protein
LVGAIIALYLLKMKRKEMRVPASFLWPNRVEEIRANSLFQRLRFSWLMVLQLLAAILACAALARPQIVTKGLSGQSTVVVIDSSLTMGSTDVKPSRLEVAKEKARQIVNAAPVGERIAVINAGIHPEVIGTLGHDPAGQLRAINSIVQTDAPPTVGEALRIAAALVGSNESGRIVLLSDGRFGDGQFGRVTNFAPGKASVSFESIGSRDDNLSISAFGITDSIRGRELFVAVRNSGSVAEKANLNVYADEKSVESEAISVAVGGEWSKTYPVQGGTQLYRGELECQDALAADNSITVSARRGGSLRVLLVATDDPFTEKALALDPRVTLDKSNDVPQSELTANGSRYDLLVFDGVPERTVTTPAVLVLGNPLGGKPAGRRLQFLSQTKDPLLDAVDLSQIAVERGEGLDGAGTVVATSSAGPELEWFDGPQRKVVLGFSPLHSDFPLQPSFPIFIANCLTFLSASDSRGPLVVPPAHPFAVRAQSNAELIDAEHHSTQVRPMNGLATFFGVGRTGRYRLITDGQTRDLYCSLAPNTVAIAPIAQLAAGSSKIRSSAAALSAVDVWRYVLVGLLCLLTFEWFFYGRHS